MRADRLMGIFVIIIMVSSIAGIAVYNIGDDPESEGIVDNTFDVEGNIFYEDLSQSSYNAIVSNSAGEALEVPFRADPRNMSHITINDDALQTIKAAEKIYLVFDPNAPDFIEYKNNLQLAMGQVSRLISLVTVNQIYPISALTADIPNETYDDDIPLKNCVDATNTAPILLFKVGTVDSVILEDNCIIVSGKTGEDLIYTADKLGMYLVGLRV
jgi:hypothetical protein